MLCTSSYFRTFNFRFRNFVNHVALSLQPDLVDLRYFKLITLLDQTIYKFEMLKVYTFSTFAKIGKTNFEFVAKTQFL